MVKYYPSLTPDLSSWALSQSVFFVASAPLRGAHINISPKGLPSSSFAVFTPNQCAYVDATGSGNETISHIYENGRVTIMFCSFETSPRIMRFFCTGRVVEWDQAEFEGLMGRVLGGDRAKRVEGARAVIVLDVFKVQTSCGFGVPLLALKPDAEKPGEVKPYLQDRETMRHWAGKKIEKGELGLYQQEWNYDSLDGLAGLRAARRSRGERMWIGDARNWLRRHSRGVEMVLVALLSSLVTLVLVSDLGVAVLKLLNCMDKRGLGSEGCTGLLSEALGMRIEFMGALL